MTRALLYGLALAVVPALVVGAGCAAAWALARVAAIVDEVLGGDL